MIIRFQASEEELSGAPVEEVDQLFFELIRASMYAKHYVIIDRIACDWAAAHLTLGARQMAHLDHLRQNFTQKASILSETNTVLNVGINSPALEHLEAIGYRIGHRSFLKGNFFELPVLVVEHAANDGDFVREIFAMLRPLHPVKSFSFETRHGGGSSIVSAFDRELRERRVVVCMVDSDLIAPTHSESPTVKALKRTAGLGVYVGDVFVTRCREIENHIPLHIIRNNNLSADYPDYGVLEEICDPKKLENPWLFYDLKNGFIGSAEARKKLNRQTQDWLRGTFTADNSDIEGITISGFGPNILRVFLSSNKSISDMSKHVRTPMWRSVFDSFFEDMLWYFAADKRRAAI